MPSFNNPLLKKQHPKLSSAKPKVALDALLEMYNDPDYAEHQHHSDPNFTTQNGKDYAGRGSTEVEDGALSASIPGKLIASREFEITRTASGISIKKISDTKSYGMNTPNGGTPETPKPTPNMPNPPSPQPPNPVPEVNSQNKTPQQLHDEAQNSPSEAGNLTQQQLQQVVEALKTSAVPIKETPTMLPPRDDIRRHIDENAQDEVMDGVHTPVTPQSNQVPTAIPQAPQGEAQAPTAQQELLRRALANKKKAWFADDDDDDDNGQYGTLYGKPLDKSKTDSIKERLEYLRSQLRDDSISTGELGELESLAEYIEPDDVELLEAAGVPEKLPENQPTARKRFRPTNKDKVLLKSMGIKAKKAVQTQELVNQVCPSCHGQNFNKVNSEQEDGSLVECLNCGCFFAV